MGRVLPTDKHITYQLQYRKCGNAAVCLICQTGQGHGPYFIAYWREAGKLKSAYVGKTLPAGAQLPREYQIDLLTVQSEDEFQKVLAHIGWCMKQRTQEDMNGHNTNESTRQRARLSVDESREEA